MSFQVIQSEENDTLIYYFRGIKANLFPFSGGSSRLESVGEDDELFMENGIKGCEVVEKPPPAGRKHSLPQQLDMSGVRQVSQSFTLFFILLKVHKGKASLFVQHHSYSTQGS